MPIERFNGSKLGLTHDESRPESGTHEMLPESAIRPEVETPFDRANKLAAEKKAKELTPAEVVDPATIDESTVDDTKELAAEMNARYEAKHPVTQVEDAHMEQTQTIDVNPTVPEGYRGETEEERLTNLRATLEKDIEEATIVSTKSLVEDAQFAKSVETEHALPINTNPLLSPQAKKVLDTNIQDFHSVTEADDTLVSDIVADSTHTEADAPLDGDMKYDNETHSWVPASETTRVISKPEGDFYTRSPEEVEQFIAASMDKKVPEGYENAKDLSVTTTPIAVKAEDMMQDISNHRIKQENTIQDGVPTTHASVNDEDEPDPSLESIRPTDAASTIVLIAALMEILASQVKDDDDLPTMEQLHFTRENLQVILGNPQIGKSFFEVFKDMLLASDYADLAFDFMFEGPEFKGMDKKSLIAGAKFAYSHMA